MDTIIDQQVAMDEALVPHAKRLRIGRSNFRLLSDIKSKESTLQLVYNVLCLSLFFKAFLVTADVPEIYMQEFWATTTVHHHAIKFKMDNKKHIEEILASLHFLGHSAVIRKLTDVNINKIHQPWRSFAAIINKCLTGKSSGYDSLRLSQAQMLWGLYHKRNVDFAYLMWENFVYQVEHKDTKKSNEMYYSRFTKVIIHHVLFSIHEGYHPPLHVKGSFNSKEEQVATGATPPKPKASVRKTRSSSNTTITPPTTVAGPRLTTSQKGKQATTSSKSKSLSALSEVAMIEAQHAYEGTGSIPRVLDVPTDESEEELSWNSTDEEGDDDEGKDGDDDEEDDGDDGEEGDEFLHVEEEPRDEESFDPIPKTHEDTDDEGNGRGMQTTQEVEDSHVTLTPINPDGQQQSSSVSSQFVTSMLNLTLDVEMELIFETTSQMDVQTPTSVASFPMSVPTITPSTITIVNTIQHAPTLPTTAPSTLLQDLPNFGLLFGFDNRLKTLEANFSEFMQMN
uniref:Uncharacterized protein n=1 Tax=Tanacetum cinerariifolium TaxID=118510 RepID=A0A699HR49_TANCI|nr:hypothetical protein [Tanacetum cinerariifolium]